MSKKFILSIISVLVIAIVAINLWNIYKKEQEELTIEEQLAANEKIQWTAPDAPEEGKPAPDFELQTLTGESLKLSDYHGNVVILNFWTSWCPPCKAEMPHMQNFYEENKGRDIQIIAVNLTDRDHGIDKVKNFVTEHGLTFPIPLDENDEVGRKYQAYGIPTSYVIDREGNIVKKISGPMDEELMQNLTKDL